MGFWNFSKKIVVSASVLGIIFKSLGKNLYHHQCKTAEHRCKIITNILKLIVSSFYSATALTSYDRVHVSKTVHSEVDPRLVKPDSKIRAGVLHVSCILLGKALYKIPPSLSC